MRTDAEDRYIAREAAGDAMMPSEAAGRRLISTRILVLVGFGVFAIAIAVTGLALSTVAPGKSAHSSSAIYTESVDWAWITHSPTGWPIENASFSLASKATLQTYPLCLVSFNQIGTYELQFKAPALATSMQFVNSSLPTSKLNEAQSFSTADVHVACPTHRGSLEPLCLGLGCGLQDRASTAAPPFKSCGQTLFDYPAGVLVYSFTRPGTYRIPKFLEHPGQRIGIRFVHGCASGVNVSLTPTGGLAIGAIAHTAHWRTVDGSNFSITAVVVTREPGGTSVMTVRRPSGAVTRLIFYVPAHLTTT
jgi:hypothetical protein